MTRDIRIRRLHSHEEYAECVRLQGRIWGDAFSERVPHAILKVGQRIGGVTAGAFEGSGRMVGFIFGLTGVERGALVHWSDMLAVLPELRDRGIGRRLKEYQRAELIGLGVELIYWTFDPLVARNAHLNLNRLGARATEYAIDMYGPDTASELQRGLGTDRLIIAWRIAGEWPEVVGRARPSSGAAPQPIELVKIVDGGPAYDASALRGTPERLVIAVPDDISRVQAESLELAARWRRATREAFTRALDAGYRIIGFARPGPGESGCYLLERGAA